MRVFILSTGRCGSMAIYNACKHMDNYTTAHESLCDQFGQKRFDYPENHIESDNRLSWHLGQLDSIFGDDEFYIHLKRNRDDVAASFTKRFEGQRSIMNAFCAGIRMTPHTELTPTEKLYACYDYIDTINYNIELFLKNKSKKMTIDLENIDEDFSVFWERIGAIGNLDKALEEFKQKHNSSS